MTVIVMTTYTYDDDEENQSPINIDTKKTSDIGLAPFNLQSYDTTKPVTIENNGHALEVVLSNGAGEGQYDITGGGLNGTFRAVQFHFHFGSNDMKGSEHTVDGKRYPADMHIVHYDTAYGSVNEAIKKKGGIAVLGFFLEVLMYYFKIIGREIKETDSPREDPADLSSGQAEPSQKNFRRLLSRDRHVGHVVVSFSCGTQSSAGPILVGLLAIGLHRPSGIVNNQCTIFITIQHTVSEDDNPALILKVPDAIILVKPHTHQEMENFTLSDLLPSSLDKFWRYDGSLTTPLCNEVVTWTLFEDTIEISNNQLNNLRTMMSDAIDDEGNKLPMENNFRDLQSLGTRTVYAVTVEGGPTPATGFQ
eukprot:XP_011670431.1 PREDICTED: carbonic anhydrase 4-like [Strongylocentrotus purpuratus]